MKIYIASSWKNQHAVEMLTDALRSQGHTVFSFVEAANDLGVIKETPVCQYRKNENLYREDHVWIDSVHGKKIFDHIIHSIMRSDVIIYIGPSGIDAWAEVGMAYAKGLPVLGLWSKSEKAGLMRRMVIWCKDFGEVLRSISETENLLNRAAGS